MLSFNKAEPPFRWRGKTSVLDDWSGNDESVLPSNWTWNGLVLYNCPTSNVLKSFWGWTTKRLPFCSGRRESSSWLQTNERIAEISNCKSIWPFDWDWNGIFCHDFPLVVLPDTVLLDLLKLVDKEDRMQLSFTCHKMRQLIVKNKTTAMDRRKEANDFVIIIEDEKFLFTLCVPGHISRQQSFNDVRSFMEYSTMIASLYSCEKVVIYLRQLSSFPFDLSEVVEIFENSAVVIDVSQEDMDYQPADVVIEKIFEEFLKYEHVEQVHFAYDIPPKWDEYCTTVTMWAESQGIEVETLPSRYGFGKEFRDGDSFVVIRGLL